MLSAKSKEAEPSPSRNNPPPSHESIFFTTTQMGVTYLGAGAKAEAEAMAARARTILYMVTVGLLVV